MASVESKATRHIWGKIGLIMGGKKIGVFKLPLLGMLDSMEKRSISAVNHRAVVPGACFQLDSACGAGVAQWSCRTCRVRLYRRASRRVGLVNAFGIK